MPGRSNHRSLRHPLQSSPCGRAQLTPLLIIGQGFPRCPFGWHWARNQGVRVSKKAKSLTSGAYSQGEKGLTMVVQNTLPD